MVPDVALLALPAYMRRGHDLNHAQIPKVPCCGSTQSQLSTQVLRLVGMASREVEILPQGKQTLPFRKNVAPSLSVDCERGR